MLINSHPILPQSTPFRNLLHSSPTRSQSQQHLIQEMVMGNKIFARLNISPTTISSSLLLIYTQDSPYLLQLHSDELYLVVQGEVFEYLQRDECSLMRKLTANDYCVPLKSNLTKYHLMAERNTLVAKVAPEAFHNCFKQPLFECFKQDLAFLCNTTVFRSVPKDAAAEICRFLVEAKYSSGEQIVQKISVYIYIVYRGRVKVYNEEEEEIKIMSVGEILGMECSKCIADGEVEVKRIEKRVLATIMESWNIQNKKPIWSWIDVNKQIIGENQQSQYLCENVQRIRNQEIRTRNTKLKFLQMKNQNKRQQIVPMTPTLSVQRREYRLNQTRVVIRSKSQQMLRGNKIVYRRASNKNVENKVNHIQIQTWQDEKVKNRPITRSTTAYEYAMRSLQMPRSSSLENKVLSKINKQKHSLCAEITISSHSLQLTNVKQTNQQKNKHSVDLKIKKQSSQRNKLMPYHSVRIESGGQIEKQLFSSLLDQRKKSIMALSANNASERHSFERLLSMKSIKRMQKKAYQQIQMANVVSIDDNVFGRMSSLTQNPLLFKIERERKKRVELLNLTKKKNTQKQLSSPSHPQPLIMIRNNQ